jgi:hypothetical protein
VSGSSIDFEEQPSPQPSPRGRGGRPRRLASDIDLKNRADYGFGNARTELTPDSVQLLQVGVDLQQPPISPLSLRERVRGAFDVQLICQE